MEMKKILSLILFLFVIQSGFCQSHYVKTDNEKLGHEKPNSIYYEQWGAGGTYSLNYGREIQLFSILYTIPSIGIERLHKDSYQYSYILRNDFDFKFNSNSINFGGAYTFGRLNVDSDFNFWKPQTSGTTYNRFFSPSLGYSRYFLQETFFCNFSLFAIHYINKPEWYPYAGIKVGVKF